MSKVSIKFNKASHILQTFSRDRGTTHLVVGVQRGQPARRTLKVTPLNCHAHELSSIAVKFMKL